METIEQILARSKMAGFGEAQNLIRMAYHLGRETAFAEAQNIISR